MLWLLLALPAAAMLIAYSRGEADAMDLLHPTGETAARLMVVAMAIGPLADLFGRRPWTLWLLSRRRYFGFAAFLYALGHLAFYVIDMGTLADMLAEITEHAIWTGWAALLLMAAPGLTSTDAAMRALRRHWKPVQRLAYATALFTLLHWVLIGEGWGPALIHFAPLVALNLARLWKRKGVPA